MDLGNLSRNAQNANHYRDVLRKRGYTYRGDKLWEATEDAIVRSTAHLTVAEAQKRLPHRSCRAVERRRKNIAVSRRKLKPWTTLEDRTLRNNINLDYPAIAKLLPGRSVHAVQGRAWYLGVRKGCLRRPKPKGLPIYDQLRDRAFEDGISQQALDCELRTGKYFQDNHQRTLNWKKLTRAVEFFGGEMKVDWKDV
jgi:hypothetical protein